MRQKPSPFDRKFDKVQITQQRWGKTNVWPMLSFIRFCKLMNRILKQTNSIESLSWALQLNVPGLFFSTPNRCENENLMKMFNLLQTNNATQENPNNNRQQENLGRLKIFSTEQHSLLFVALG